MLNHMEYLSSHQSKKEMKVYLIDLLLLSEEEASLNLNKISDEQFIDLAKRRGSVYSERGFENAYNHDETFDFVNTYIRILE